jgi:hypothetical protein
VVAVLLAGLHSALAFHDPLASLRLASGGTPRGVTNSLAVEANSPVTHLLVSEVMTGGTSASDEFIEIYNPTAAPLPLEGLEVVYVTASGGTITRKASWPAGSPAVPAGAHVLVANSAGIFAFGADLTYTGGLAATGGSVAIRILAAASAIDAAGWGDATSTWLEGVPAAAVAAGHSLERLPGGAAGSGQDTNQNSVDFVDNAAPEPQGTAASPIPIPTPTPSPSPAQTATPPVATPSATDTPTAPATSSPTAVATASPTPAISVSPTASPTPSPTVVPSATEPISISEARSLPDGATVLVKGSTLTDSAFSDGGGYIADASGGIAVLLSDGSFARGALIEVTGSVDDRFSQRTIRADAAGIQVAGSGTDPVALFTGTGLVGEPVEGALVEIHGQVASSATVLTSGVAYDLDDGSGPIRVLVGTATGIDTTGWERGVQLQLRGVVGQRDSSGTGSSGYRVQPRDAADILSVTAPTPSPSPTPAPSTTATPSPSADPSVITIAAARALPTNTRLSVRGIVTLQSGLVEDGTAAIQDATGAIVLRLGDEAGTLRLGELVEVAGTRSTKAGMETLRVTVPARRLGDRSLPDPRRRETGALGEADEAMLVVVRGAITTTPRRTSADNVYFDVDDGSGPIRVFAAPGASVETETLLSGTTVEVTGVLGQETTGRLPDRGYRLWPRRSQDLEVISQPAGAGGVGAGGSVGGASGGGDGSYAPGSSGASPTTAGTRGGRGVSQQNRPRLVPEAAAPTTPSMRLPATARTSPLAPDEPSAPLAAGLLALGGLLLIGSGVATGRPELPKLLLGWLRNRLRRSDGVVEEVPLTDDAEPSPALPRLVPRAVAEETSLAVDRMPRVVREERGRILPPT